MARTTKGYGIKDDARRSHLSLGDGEWAEVYYEGLTANDAARRGRGIHKQFRDTQVVTTSERISTKSSIYFNLSATTASRVLVCQLLVGCHSTGAGVHASVGWCTTSGANASTLTFTALNMDYGFHVGGAQARNDVVQHLFCPPLLVTYTGMGARCVTLRHKTKTTASLLNLGWSGWREVE